MLSRIVGWIAASTNPLIKSLFIGWAIKRFNVDLSQAEIEDPADFKSFNDFFTRALKTGARPIAGEFCSPADGEVSQAGPIVDGQLLQAKGIHYRLDQLLGLSDVSAFSTGRFITIYLSPRDYHRVHSPITGQLKAARYIPGKLFSVNQQTAESIPGLFAINERLVMDFDTEHGPVSVIMVGAVIVAGIQPIWRDQPYLPKVYDEEELNLALTAGGELGRFLMGSTAIVVSAKSIDFRHQAGDSVVMGEHLI